MSYKTVCCVVTDDRADRFALDAAADLARREGGHLDVFCLGIDSTPPGLYYAGTNAAALQAGIAEADARAHRIEARVQQRLAGQALSWASCATAAPMPGLSRLLAHLTRLSDIAVLARPYGPGRGHAQEAVVESELFDAAVPVLVVPDGSPPLPEPLGKVVIAWNDSHEALAAVRAALPVLRRAGAVSIAIVDPPPHAPDRSDPGGALSQMLARHGVKAEIAILARTMPRVSDVIARHLTDQAAELLVMGAYGHSRLRESILGGATRHMLQRAEVPILMAH